MKVFRNLLVTYGACALSARFVGLFSGALTFPLSLRGGPGVNVGSAMVISTGAACLAALLAGVAAGVVVETNWPARWSLLLGVLVWFEYGGGFRPHVIVEEPTMLYLALTSFAAAVVAVLTFHGVRALTLRRTRVARAS